MKFLILDITGEWEAMLKKDGIINAEDVSSDYFAPAFDGERFMKDLDDFMKSERRFWIPELSKADIGEGKGNKLAAMARALLSYFKKMGLADGEPRLLVVFEEAAEIFPSSNSKETPVVVLTQGRKFGVGGMIIYQRSAMAPKNSITQCATWIGLRGAELDFNPMTGEHRDGDAAEPLAEGRALVGGKAFRLHALVEIELLKQPDEQPGKQAGEQPDGV